jgi:hypothetical protein
MFKCHYCYRIIRRVEDVRGCARCDVAGRARTIPDTHSDSDMLTAGILGYALGGGFSSHSSSPSDDSSFSGGGGSFSGAGASGSWDSGSSSSSDSGSSSSSDPGGSSFGSD